MEAVFAHGRALFVGKMYALYFAALTTHSAFSLSPWIRGTDFRQPNMLSREPCPKHPQTLMCSSTYLIIFYSIEFELPSGNFRVWTSFQSPGGPAVSTLYMFIYLDI